MKTTILAALVLSLVTSVNAEPHVIKADRQPQPARRRVVPAPPCQPIIYQGPSDCMVRINCDGTFTFGCP